MFGLSSESFWKVAKGAGLAMAGAGLTFVYSWATSTDLGTAGPLVAAGVRVLLNFVRKLAEEYAATPQS